MRWVTTMGDATNDACFVAKPIRRRYHQVKAQYQKFVKYSILFLPYYIIDIVYRIINILLKRKQFHAKLEERD